MLRENEFSVFSKLASYLLITLAIISALINIYSGMVPHPIDFIFVIFGFILFLISKLSVFKQGIPVSFGTNNMTPLMANIYRLGYWIMIVGIILTFEG